MLNNGCAALSNIEGGIKEKMKHIFTSICLGLALIFTASAQDRHQNSNDATVPHRGNARASSGTAAPRMTARTVARPAATQRHMSTAPVRQRTFAETPRTNASTSVRSHNNTTAGFREGNRRVTSRNRVENNAGVNRERNFRTNRERNFAVNRERNMRVSPNRNVTVNRNERRISFNQAVNLHRNEFHSRDWWRSHFTTIVFVNSGWWFWDAGWWFPAYGYAPGAYYPYAGPIYGYNGLTPDRVVVDVQLQLQRDGYYAGPIDGVLGPMTRQALTAFQADNGLAVTSTIDEQTMATLGLS